MPTSPSSLLPSPGPLGLWQVAGHVPIPGSDLPPQAPSPYLSSLWGPPASGALSFCEPVLSSHAHPVGPSVPRAAAGGLGGARSSVPSGRPAAAGACHCPSPGRWSPVTHSPAIFLQVRAGCGCKGERPCGPRLSPLRQGPPPTMLPRQSARLCRLTGRLVCPAEAASFSHPRSPRTGHPSRVGFLGPQRSCAACQAY